jgi:phosphoribosylaminoimidazole carboxylase (NCAIR synthetase)
MSCSPWPGMCARVTSLLACLLCAQELFLCTDGSLLLNEVAPRPHNSAHYSIEACHTSQFEQVGGSCFRGVLLGACCSDCRSSVSHLSVP